MRRTLWTGFSCESPEGEVKEVEATTEALTPLMVAGWHQVPAPAATARSR